MIIMLHISNHIVPVLRTSTDLTASGGLTISGMALVNNISIPLLTNVGYFTLQGLPLLVNFPVFARLQSMISLTIASCATLVTIPNALFPNLVAINMVTLDTLVMWRAHTRV